MPCQKAIDSTPATLNTSEKTRKYHFLPRKSMFVLRKNSKVKLQNSASSCEFRAASKLVCYRLAARSSRLNTQCLSTLLPTQHPIKNHARYEHCGKQVGRQTEHQGGRKPLHRPGPEDEQNRGGNDGRDVGINDRNPRMAESLLHRRRRRLAVP